MSGDTKPPENPDLQTINRYLTLWGEELKIDQRKVDARINHQNNMKEVALASIAAQKEDRQELRKVSQVESTKNKIFIVAIVLILMGFSGFLVWKGYADLAKQIITYSLTAIIAAFGGYGYAIKRMGSMSGTPQE